MRAFGARCRGGRTASAVAIGLLSATVAAGLLGISASGSVYAVPPTFFFSSGNPDGLMAMASGKAGAGPRTEAADDFVVTSDAGVTSATFTGLLPANPGVAGVQDVEIEFYRVFPLDSVNPPSGNVPTRVNSPSDVAYATRDAASAGATFSVSVVNPSFTTGNSVLNGIHPSPNQTIGGEGPVTGIEVQFSVSFTTPVLLPLGHYYFVPQVQMSSGMFMWLSAPFPVVAPGTPFVPDLQAEIRNASLEPDWLRVGTDIVGGVTPPRYNAAFTLSGETCVAMDASPNPLPDGTAGSPYSQQLVGSGGVAPYTFAETGALPSGVTLTAAGLLAGTTSDVGTFPIAVAVTDVNGCTSTVSRSLTIAAAATTTAATTTTAAPTTTTAPTTTAPTTTPAAATTAPAGGALPATGRSGDGLVPTALGLMAVGALALWLSRRRGFIAGG